LDDQLIVLVELEIVDDVLAYALAEDEIVGALAAPKLVGSAARDYGVISALSASMRVLNYPCDITLLRLARKCEPRDPVKGSFLS
jgi:hypothetical protein